MCQSGGDADADATRVRGSWSSRGGTGRRTGTGETRAAFQRARGHWWGWRASWRRPSGSRRLSHLAVGTVGVRSLETFYTEAREVCAGGTRYVDTAAPSRRRPLSSVLWQSYAHTRRGAHADAFDIWSIRAAILEWLRRLQQTDVARVPPARQRACLLCSGRRAN